METVTAVVTRVCTFKFSRFYFTSGYLIYYNMGSDAAATSEKAAKVVVGARARMCWCKCSLRELPFCARSPL